MSVWIALILIAVCALLWDAGIVLQKSAVDRAPRLQLGRSVGTSVLSLLKSPRWMAGLAASAIGWGLFALALSAIPVSIARAMQGSGFVILAVLSVLFLKHRLSVGEWVGVALVTAGIVTLGIAASQGNRETTISPGALGGAIAACLLVCAGAALIPRLLRPGRAGVTGFSIIAGILLGLGDVATKTLLAILAGAGGVPRAVIGGAVVAAAVALVIFYSSGFVTLSRAYQLGRAILVTAVSDLCSRLVALFVGYAALGESLPTQTLLRVCAILGYAGIALGAVLLSRFSGDQVTTDFGERRRSR